MWSLRTWEQLGEQWRSTIGQDEGEGNPTHPDEDYADKWSKDPRLELSFLQWHSQAVRDFETPPTLMDPVALKAATKRSFRVDLRDDHLRSLGLASSAPAIIVTPAAPRVQISSPSRPWGSGD